MQMERNGLRHFKMEVSYDGTDFKGWQVQPNVHSVQGVIEKKLFTLFGNTPIRILGSSRTDAGVHALGMVASFTAPPSPYIPDKQVKKALNSLLPSSISIKDIQYVDEDFNARYSAKGKAYTYVINRGVETPFNAKYSWHQPNCTDTDAVRKAVKYLEGTHDFSAFAANVGIPKDPIKTIYRIDVQELGDFLCVSFVGNGFLYKMIRGIMGALAPVGYGKFKPDDVRTFLESRDRTQSPPTCPPHGLFLMKVFYEEDEWTKFKLTNLPFFQ